MIPLSESAFAKINLYLHVLAKRPDGYHTLDSLVAFADVADRLEAVPAERLSLRVTGPHGAQLAVEDNTVLRAAEALRAYAGITAGAAITLHKHLPLAAGIGGGSADAAASLRLLTRLWSLAPPEEALKAIALDIGADVPACLSSQCQYMGGVGEMLESGPDIAGMFVVLANSGKHLKTPDVFAQFEGPFSLPVPKLGRFESLEVCIDFIRHNRNALEPAALSLLPEIASVLKALDTREGCLLSRMSGSGATCFGLFTGAQAARRAAAALRARNPSWWVESGALR